MIKDIFSHKYFWAIILSAAFPLLLTTYIAVQIAENALQKQVADNLSLIANNKIADIDNFIQRAREDAGLLGKAPFIITAVQEAGEAVKRHEKPPASLLSGSQAQYFIRYFFSRSGYSYKDLILLSPKGEVLFSLKRPQIIGEPLNQSFLKDTQALKLFSNATTLLETQISDFEAVKGAENPEAFIATPILNGQSLLGVLVLQMDNQAITKVVSDLEGLGATGETLVGNVINHRISPEVSLRFASISDFLGQSQTLDPTFLQSFIKASKGEKGTGLMKDYRGKEVISTWRYVPSLGWAMLVKLDVEEAYSPIERMKKNMIVLGVLALGLVMTIAALVSRRLEKAENDLNRALSDLRIAMIAAEEASKTKSEFLANMSHELRTPLNAIIGYTELLQEDAEDRQLTDFGEDLTKIHISATHLLGLINEILDLSKIESGKIELCLEDVDIQSIIRSIQNLITPVIQKNDNQFVLECAPEAKMIHTDVTRLTQCLLNLLSNAAKFTKNGSITLRVTEETEITKKGEPWITFIVTDTGIGMTRPQIKKLFQPFSQADASLTRKYGGTGLGLYISKRFCEMLGGSITVVSEPEKGSTFTIYLPAKGPPM